MWPCLHQALEQVNSKFVLMVLEKETNGFFFLIPPTLILTVFTFLWLE